MLMKTFVKEVKHLLRVDNEAVEVKHELVNEEELEQKRPPVGERSGWAVPGAASNESNAAADEHELFGVLKGNDDEGGGSGAGPQQTKDIDIDIDVDGDSNMYGTGGASSSMATADASASTATCAGGEVSFILSQLATSFELPATPHPHRPWSQ